MKYIILTILSVLSSLLHAQVGKQFPPLIGESLTNKSVTLPDDIKGKYSVIGLAYSKNSEAHLKSWMEPAYRHFIHKPEKGSVFLGAYHVNIYFIPMFTGVMRPAYKNVMKKVQKTIDVKLLPYVLFYKGEFKKYRKILGYKGKDVPYFFVLDPNGKIIHATYGLHTRRKMQELVNHLGDAWY